MMYIRTSVNCLYIHMFIHISLFSESFIFISGVIPCDNEQMAISTHSRISSYHLSTSNDSLEMPTSFPCPICPAKFIEKFELKAHMSQNHGDQMPFCCRLCGKGYQSYQGLKHHQLSYHEGQMFVCPICDRRMNYKSVYKRHLRGVHKSDQCSRCMQMIPLEEFALHVKTCMSFRV